MKLAAYETRDLKVTKHVRGIVGMAMLAIAAQIAFWQMPPIIWANDAPWLATGSWLLGAVGQFYKVALARSSDVIPVYTHVMTAFMAAWRVPVDYGIAFEFYTRIAGCLLAALGAWFGASAIMVSEADIVDTRQHYEGLELQRGAAAVASLSGFMAHEDREQGLGIGLTPGITLSRLREIRGVLIRGATGSGKTRIILHLLQEVFAAMRRSPERNVRVLIHDTTGEILSGLPLPDDAFAALHGHRPGGYAWAVGRDVVSKTDAEAFGAVMAPHTEENVWEAGSGTLLAGCAILCQIRYPRTWGMPEFYGAALLDPIKLKQLLTRRYPPAAQLIEVDGETGALSRTTVSFFLSFRASVLRFLRPLAENWADVPAARKFSFRDWLDGTNRNQPGIVVLQRSGRYPELSSAWIGAIVDAIAAHANDESFANSQVRRIFLFLDELASLGRLRRLPDLLDIGRNKGVGVMAAIHEEEQLQERYGDRVATSMLRRFRTKIICQQNLDGGTVRLSEDVIGKRTVETTATTTTTTKGPEGKTTSETKAQEREEVPIIRAERLAYELGVFGRTVKALVAGAGNPAIVRWPVTIWPRRR